METNIEERIRENPAEAIKTLADYFAGFKQQQARKPKRVNDDDFYASNHRLTRLLDLEGKPTGLYIYDKNTYCKGCSHNCGRDYNTIELRASENEKRINEVFDVSVETPHELSRNFVVGLTRGYPIVEIKTWRENYPEKIRTAKIEGKISDYEATLELIRKIRAGS